MAMIVSFDALGYSESFGCLFPEFVFYALKMALIDPRRLVLFAPSGVMLAFDFHAASDGFWFVLSHFIPC
jgi:hypothetical protein